MAKHFKITEEQRQILMKEGIVLNADVAAANGNIDQAVRTTKDQARKDNVNLDNAKIQFNASDTNEGKTYTIKELREARIKKLMERGTKYTVKDFMSKR